MDNYLSSFKIDASPKCNSNNMFTYKNTRFSVITPYLIRVEHQKSACFCDKPTQAVLNRFSDDIDLSYRFSDDNIVISTSKIEFTYDVKKCEFICVVLEDGRKISDLTKGNLKGTKRTLDGVNGKTSLCDGVVSLNGVAVFDDSKSLILAEDGKVLPRDYEETDVYYFCYGYKYREAVKALFDLTGHSPLIPRFTLGNWWSRYKAYTQNEYTELMQRFIDEKIPVTVATIDMDWHWVDVVKKFGKDAVDKNDRKNILEFFYNTVFPGWTGYSWNTELFPDHKAFLDWLNANGFKVTMNLHPASGCKFFEDAYEDFCNFMGIDKNSRKQIGFDITDEKFIEGYFRFLHHPHEKEGVAFWWIDWQQGSNTSIKGLDPLWALNHYHSLDISRDGKRPLILSRFAGIGSQRYPLGFSGDTVQTWKSLDFQPYFTSTASNVAYSWWSHDIGGHCRGYRDDELYLRWVQFGVFSPINRLHSTSNEFMGKEPWMYNKFVENTAVDFLRLRHRLIPYLYSMNRLTANEGRCLVEPMYYNNPKDKRAYMCPNEFWFGTELIVAPITSKTNEKTGLASTKAYLPGGRFTDIFNGYIYNGNTLIEMFRDQSSIPVLAKEGAIIPLGPEKYDNSVENPDELEILISRGNNSFILYEDDGETLQYNDGKYCETRFEVKKDYKNVIFEINAVKGDLSLIPEKRKYCLRFLDITDAENISVEVDGVCIDFDKKKIKNNLIVEISDSAVNSDIKVTLHNITAKINPSRQILLTQLLSKLKGSNDKKAAKYTSFVKKNAFTLIPSELKRAVKELDELMY